MAINDICVVEENSSWHDSYSAALAPHFPGARVTCMGMDAARLAMQERRFDLYVTHFPGADALTGFVQGVKDVRPDAHIALVTGKPHLGTLAAELGIDYFPGWKSFLESSKMYRKKV